jgi:hypothetical protein
MDFCPINIRFVEKGLLFLFMIFYNASLFKINNIFNINIAQNHKQRKRMTVMLRMHHGFDIDGINDRIKSESQVSE